jgi:hypothetical protein
VTALGRARVTLTSRRLWQRRHESVCRRRRCFECAYRARLIAETDALIRRLEREVA